MSRRSLPLPRPAAAATIAAAALPSVTPRYARLDALRGFAVLWMALFHFAFDLNYFGLIEPRQSFQRDPFWTLQRSSIVSLFLFSAGLAQAVAMHHAQGGPRFSAAFWRRWMQVAGCALLVSAASAVMFPDTWIGFGVLHGIAVMLIAVRLAYPVRGWLWLLGALALALPWLLPLALRPQAFDTPWLSWLGLVTKKPRTEDWVPLLPWLGVMFWGLAAGQWLLARERSLLTRGLPDALRPLALLGRFSLSFYMLHQPVLIGALAGGRAIGWW